MNDKKIITVAVILSLALIVGGWYFSKHNPQNASVSGPKAETPLPTATVPGISYGNPNAPVVIEEYTNFLCSACAAFAKNTFPRINSEYVASGKVRFIYYVYPPIELTKAALCAQEQNKFMEYHEYIFAHQTQITGEQDLKTFANNAGLDMSKFNACYDDQSKFKEIVGEGSQPGKWYQEGTARGIDATPSFFINGQKLIGAQPYEEFKKIIDEKLNQQ